jgi:hypothetical protein
MLNENTSTTNPIRPKTGSHGVGPAISVVLLIIIMIAGAIYFLYARLSGL